MKKIGQYTFKNPGLLKEALTHPSLTYDGTKLSYERLEFLGDSVLSLVIAEFLIENYPEESEGHLAKRHAALICGNTLSRVAEEAKIGKFIAMAEGEKQMGGRVNPNNLENALEAIIGAVYLDGGLESARKFVLSYWKQIANEMKEPPLDPKSELQEWAQGNDKPLPSYKIIKREGPSHAPVFTIEVKVKGLDPVTAEGSSKKIAERIAAERLLEVIHDG